MDLPPHKIREFIDLLENKVKYREIISSSRSRREPLATTVQAQYSRPNPTYLSRQVFEHDAKPIAPLMKVLNE